MEIDTAGVIAQLQAENEQLRKKLTILFMQQESLWQHARGTITLAYRSWRARHTEEDYQLALWLVIMAISLLIQLIRKKFGL